MMRYRYLGDRLTAPQLREMQCDPVRDPRGKCIVSTKMATALVVDAQGRRFVVARRRLRLNTDKHDSLRCDMKRVCWYCGTKSEGRTCTCCDADLDAQEAEIAELNGLDPKGHEGFWMDVDGEPVHMLADPNMSEETAEALSEVVRAARRMLEEEQANEQ